MRTEELTYRLPDSAIAQTPVDPRDSARLLDTRTGLDHHVRDLPGLLEPGDLVVVNTTRVRRARLVGAKAATGGTVELLLLDHRGGGRWDALVRPARRVRSGLEITIADTTVRVLTEPDHGEVVVEVDGDAETLMELHGQIPLPPYIHQTLDDPDRYQTVYSDVPGSAAAPTAGLHLTDDVVSGLDRRSIDVASVDLHVGIGTFRPIGTERVEDHAMHAERYEVARSAVDAIRSTKSRGGRVVGIGTTVVRALESAAATGDLRPVAGATQLFITPGFRFRVVDLLMTNFHVPGSTLLAMIAAFRGPEWRSDYNLALRRGYRFLSFGDAMLLERRR